MSRNNDYIKNIYGLQVWGESEYGWSENNEKSGGCRGVKAGGDQNTRVATPVVIAI